MYKLHPMRICAKEHLRLQTVGDVHPAKVHLLPAVNHCHDSIQITRKNACDCIQNGSMQIGAFEYCCKHFVVYVIHIYLPTTKNKKNLNKYFSLGLKCK